MECGRIERIDSPRDERVADYLELRDADRMRTRGVFIAEGTEVVRVMLLGSRYRTRSVLTAARHLERLAPALERAAVPVYVAEDSVLTAIAGFDLHRGCLASGLLEAPPNAEELLDASGANPGTRELVLVLEGIANHDNVGALFRNGAAFGARALLLDPSCAHPLYRKSIRVSMGTALTTPWGRLPAWPEGLEVLRDRGFELWALTPHAEAEELGGIVRGEATIPGKVALLVGTEGTGLTDAALARVHRRVRIPMATGVDSLNVATAAAIAAFAIRAC